MKFVYDGQFHTVRLDKDTDLPVGILRSSFSITGRKIKFAYSEKFGYHVCTGFTMLAKKVALELGQTMFEACLMVEDHQPLAVIKAVRIEHKRLKSSSFFVTPAA